MIRIALFLIALAIIAFGASWFAERPGEVVMIWQGWRISTSVTVAAAAFLAALAVAIVLWSLFGLMLNAPKRIAAYFRAKQQLRGWRAITRGLIAVGTGNALLAQRAALEARKLLAQEPLTLLLAAQTAQLRGQTEAAETEFRTMLARPETKLLGLRGLYIEAHRRSDAAAAMTFAEEAVRLDPALVWAGEALIESQCRAGNWSEALKILDRQIGAKAIGKPAGKRRRAVLLTAQAQAVEETNPGQARELAGEAARLAPDLIPAVAVAGRLEGAAGNLRRAARMIEKVWVGNPHPELAEVYVDLRPGDTAKDRLKRAKTLAQKAVGHVESWLIVARTALEAGAYGQARDVIAPLLEQPSQRVCLLMAEIEVSEHGDHGKAREWTARAVHAKRDPAWVADGYISERWLPASPFSGKLDAFLWTVPLTTLGGPVIEQMTAPAPAIPATLPKPRPSQKKLDEEAPAAVEKPELGIARPAARRKTPVEPIVAEPPLPDDPGLEPEPESSMPRKRFRLFEWLSGPSP